METKDKKGAKYFFDFSEVWGYYFRKKNPDQKKNINLSLMHGINRIAILMFLVAVIVLIVRRLF
jgi:hypothetical protein